MQRFITAQKKYYKIAVSEIENGRKETHWIWFILPNFYSEKTSQVSKYYAIKSIDEGIKYLKNKYLRNNLLNMFKIISSKKITLNKLFGPIDAKKTVSCAKLFGIIATLIGDKEIQKYAKKIKL